MNIATGIPDAIRRQFAILLQLLGTIGAFGMGFWTPLQAELAQSVPLMGVEASSSASTPLFLLPQQCTLGQGESLLLLAVGVQSHVDWKIQEGQAGGHLLPLGGYTPFAFALYRAPADSGVFHVRADSAGQSTLATVQVTALQPSIESFTAIPNQLNLGEKVLLRWSVKEARRLWIEPGHIEVTGQDSLEVQPSFSSCFSLRAEGIRGMETAHVDVLVQQPISGNFTVEAEAISSRRGKLRWKAFEDAQSCKIWLCSEPLKDGQLPSRHHLVFQSGTDPGQVEIPNLAASTDAFFLLEVLRPSGRWMGHSALRLPGGPRVVLDSPLREVHAFSSKILQVVLGSGEGPVWQAGPWRLFRSNGSEIQVKHIHRQSLPVEQPQYQIGWGAPADGRVVRTDHRIFLELEEPIGSREVLSLDGPDQLSFQLPFSDQYLETPILQVNQVGYHPAAKKRYAYVFGWLGDGGGLSLETLPSKLRVLSDPGGLQLDRLPLKENLPLELWNAFHEDNGAPVGQIDLATLEASETLFRVQVPGVGVSWPTRISGSAVKAAYRTVLRGLYHNRWAGDLREACTVWSRPQDHVQPVFMSDNSNPYNFHPSNPEPPRIDPRIILGGYHDAGDFDQRPSHTVIAQYLMRAFELFPAAFTDGELGIPESGNGVPDLLDEALWGVAVWEALQEEDGGIRAGLESTRHPNGYYFAHQDQLIYWTYARHPNVTARGVGLFAQAARLLKPFDPLRASHLEQRARKAWEWANAHGAHPISKLYGASELYRLTQDPTCGLAFENNWKALSPTGGMVSWSGNRIGLSDLIQEDAGTGGRALPDYFLGYFSTPGHDSTLRSTFQKSLDQVVGNVLNRIFSTSFGHRNPKLPQYGAGWGELSVPGRYLDPLFASLSLGYPNDETRQRYLDAMSLCADFVLGCNPLGMSFLTGLGSRSPQEPLHLDSLGFIKSGKGPIPGIPVYGPIDTTPGNDYYQPGLAQFYPSFGDHPRFLRYGDLRSFVRCNEFDVASCQAPHAEHFAILMALLPDAP